VPLHFATVPRSTGLKPLSYTNPERERLNAENTEGSAERLERKAKRPVGSQRYKMWEEGRYIVPLHFATVPRSTGLKPLSYTNPERKRKRKRLNTENIAGSAPRSLRGRSRDLTQRIRREE